MTTNKSFELVDELIDTVIAAIDLKVEALEEECERLRKDAERYQWLRARWGRIADEYDGNSDQLVAIREADSHFEGWDVDPISLDRAIDAELAKVGDA